MEQNDTSGPHPRTWRVNRRYIEYNGAPFIPIMGEFHFTRSPAAEWSRVLQKMKAAGINTVATYVFWNHHEERPGQLNLHSFPEKFWIIWWRI